MAGRHCFAGPWTLRVALQQPFHGVEGRYRSVIREELFAPMSLSDQDELLWYCAARLRRESDPAAPRDRRFDAAERRFRTPHCATLYLQYQQRGPLAIAGVTSRVLRDKLTRKEARLEFVLQPREIEQLYESANTNPRTGPVGRSGRRQARRMPGNHHPGIVASMPDCSKVATPLMRRPR